MSSEVSSFFFQQRLVSVWILQNNVDLSPSMFLSLQEGKTMFEQELYHNFSIGSSRSYFISFAGDVSVRL